MTNLLSFASQNQFDPTETYTSKLSRAFKSISSTLSPDYVINLREQGQFKDNDGRLLEMFTMFRAVSIHQATRTILPQYSQDGHKVVADMFARLYNQYFISPVDLETKMNQEGSIMPSMTFILGPAGARYLASKYDKSMTDIGWSRQRLITDINYGLHNVLVTEIVIRLMNLLRIVQIDPKVTLGLVVAGEFQGKLVARVAEQKVFARPDYTIQIRFFKEGGQPVKRTMFIEYDNGTEGMETLRKKVIEYHTSCTAAQGVLSPIKSSNILFIFNKESRAQRFVRDLSGWKQKFPDFEQPLYVGVLDNILQHGFFYRDWANIDLKANPTQPDQMALPISGDQQGEQQRERCIPNVSVYPEIDQILSGRKLYDAFKTNIDGDNEKHLRLEFDAFSRLAKHLNASA